MAHPNFLIIMSDQHNPTTLSCAGNPVVRTPHLDALAQRGVFFENAYCAAPVCVPSRMSFMSSQYPSDTNVWSNTELLSSHVPTWAHSLSLSGYETTLCGRMHFAGPDQHHGFERRLVGDVSGAMAPVTGPFQLFEGRIPLETTGQSSASFAAVGAGRSTYMAYDEVVAQRTCDYLRQREQEPQNRPFCLVAGMLLPHNPYVCPPALFREYMDKVVTPASEDIDSVHPAIAKLRRDRGADTITPDQTRRAQAAYHGLTTYLDSLVGEMLATLDQTSFARNTVIVYLSDHGEMAGKHGLWWKETFYEEACRVPMIWSWPGHFASGTRQQVLCSLVDVGPTCIELAGANDLPLARGRSLTEALEAHDDIGYGTRAIFAETYAAEQRPARMIRSGKWKLNCYHGYDAPQLFDIENDRGERQDFGCDEDHSVIRQKLLSQIHEGWSPEYIEKTKAGQNMTDRWTRQVKLGESDLWHIPPGSNELLES